MLTKNQQELFSIVLELNYEMKITTSPAKKIEALKRLIQAKDDLKKDMGEEAYNKFMDMGTKMFASKNEPSRRTTSCGDEFEDLED